MVRTCRSLPTAFVRSSSNTGQSNVKASPGEKAAQKPWEGAEGLEWEIPSPAPFHTFENPPKLDATATRIVA
jgi:heme/copper-type cytochrome/quinol oxidase subunit 1